MKIDEPCAYLILISFWKHLQGPLKCSGARTCTTWQYKVSPLRVHASDRHTKLIGSIIWECASINRERERKRERCAQRTVHAVSKCKFAGGRPNAANVHALLPIGVWLFPLWTCLTQSIRNVFLCVRQAQKAHLGPSSLKPHSHLSQPPCCLPRGLLERLWTPNSAPKGATVLPSIQHLACPQRWFGSVRVNNIELHQKALTHAVFECSTRQVGRNEAQHAPARSSHLDSSSASRASAQSPAWVDAIKGPNQGTRTKSFKETAFTTDSESSQQKSHMANGPKGYYGYSIYHLQSYLKISFQYSMIFSRPETSAWARRASSHARSSVVVVQQLQCGARGDRTTAGDEHDSKILTPKVIPRVQYQLEDNELH